MIQNVNDIIRDYNPRPRGMSMLSKVDLIRVIRESSSGEKQGFALTQLLWKIESVEELERLREEFQDSSYVTYALSKVHTLADCQLFGRY